MAIDENYLDNLLKNANEKEAELENSTGIAMSGFERINSLTHSNEIEEEPEVDDPNATLTPEQIAAMFAQSEASSEAELESEASEEPDSTILDETSSQDDIAALLSQMNDDFEPAENSEEPVEIDMDDISLLDSIIGGKDSEDIETTDDFVPEEDVNLGEIEDLLSKSDNHELVDNDNPDPFGLLSEEEIPVDEMDIDDLLVNASARRDKSDDEDVNEDNSSKKNKKKKKEKKAKKEKKQDEDKPKGFFAKVAESLTEEVEDDIPVSAAGEENMAILEELDAEDDGQKGKKGKKGKKAKEDDPKAAAKAEAAAKKKEAAKAAKAQKAKDRQQAKEEKKTQKAQREAELGPVKKLPRKKVILIFLVFVPVLVALLAVGLLVPADMELRAARTAYAEKDYDTTYKNMYGQKLNEKDQVMYNNSNCILQMRRWKKTYETYNRIEMPRESLDALISGVACYDYLNVHYDISDVSGEINSIYREMLGILENNYGISEEYAKKIIGAETDKMYTRYIDAALAGNTNYDPYKRVPIKDEAPAMSDSTESQTLAETPSDSEPSMNESANSDDEGVILEFAVDGNGNQIDRPQNDGGTNLNSNDGDRLIFEIPAQ